MGLSTNSITCEEILITTLDIVDSWWNVFRFPKEVSKRCERGAVDGREERDSGALPVDFLPRAWLNIRTEINVVFSITAFFV
jgi:hypothetical protein